MENDALGRIGKLLGLTIEQANGDTVVLALPIRPDLWQPDDIVQGGIYAVLTEAAASLGAHLWWGDRGRVVGVNNNIDFLRSVHQGTLRATANPISRGDHQQLWLVTVVDESGRQVAIGQVRLQNLSLATPSSGRSSGA
ncbi:PaaI family thioesterase [Nocardia sp. CA-135398]|uniref:PaaI family thioesterase n=1 Tax=Nocardia sp. CA-135398 TaxID=3239977 RepID=UPI003D999FE0